MNVQSLRRPATRFDGYALSLPDGSWPAWSSYSSGAYDQLPRNGVARPIFPSWLPLDGEGPKWIFVVICGAIPVLIAYPAALISIRLVKRQAGTKYCADPPIGTTGCLRSGRESDIGLDRFEDIPAGAQSSFVSRWAYSFTVAVRANLAGTFGTESEASSVFFAGRVDLFIAKIALAAQFVSGDFSFPNDEVKEVALTAHVTPLHTPPNTGIATAA